MYDEHILALIETVHRANLDAVGVFAPNAGFVDDVSHKDILQQTGHPPKPTEFKSKKSEIL